MKQITPAASRECNFALPQAQNDVALLVIHMNSAYNLARYLMRDEVEAEDIVQSAYLRALTHFAGFRGENGRAWLLTIVRNTCYDRLRKQSASKVDADFDEAIHSETTQTPDPESAMLHAERVELVRKSLADLPAESREVLILREIEQLSYQEIAEIAEIPVGTVMSRLSRARARLQQTILRKQESDRSGMISLTAPRDEPELSVNTRGRKTWAR